MATANEIYNQAVALSNLNDSTLVGETEWLDWLTSLQKRPYKDAAKVNPDYFGKEGNTSARGSSTATWSLTTAPGNVAAVSKVVVQAITGTVTGISAGDDVYVVSIREPDVEPSPRVYIRSKTIYEYNSELQDDSSNYVTTLKVYYSYLPGDITATSDNMDLYEEHNNLLVFPLAALLALRDQRPEEAQALWDLYQQERLDFINNITVFDEATTRDLTSVGASVPGMPSV